MVENELTPILTGIRSELADRFEQEFGHPPPAGLRTEFLRQNLAWRWQVRRSGQNPDKLLKRLARELTKATRTEKSHTHCHRPGTRLIREWQGVVHEVVIQADGYLWNGNAYRSLSQIAQAITGTKWSGPRFFGLKPQVAQ